MQVCTVTDLATAQAVCKSCASALCEAALFPSRLCLILLAYQCFEPNAHVVCCSISSLRQLPCLTRHCCHILAAKLPSILKVWKKLSGERPASRMNTLFVLRSKNSTSRTAAYKATFADKPHQLDKYWKTGTLDTKLRGLIGAFLQDTVLRVIIDNAGAFLPIVIRLLTLPI